MSAIRVGFALGLGVLLSSGPAYTQQLVKAGYAPFSPPLSFLPGATPANYRTLDPHGNLAQGALIDLMNAVGKDAGVHIQFVMVPASEQITALASNKIDLALMVRIGQGPGVDFTEPLYKDSEALLVKKADPKQFVTWDDLKGEVVVAIRGSAAADVAWNSGIFKEVRFVATGAEVAEAVREPEVRAGFKGSAIDTTYDQQHGAYEPDIQMSTSYRPRFAIERALGTRSGDLLLNKITTSIAKLRTDGSLKAIFIKYGIDGTLIK